jgi:hypothetical protein
MADTRLFRLTYGGGTVKYGGRTMAGAAAAATRNHPGWNYRKGLLVKVEATNAAATSGWTDVTAEFLGLRAPRG